MITIDFTNLDFGSLFPIKTLGASVEVFFNDKPLKSVEEIWFPEYKQLIKSSTKFHQGNPFVYNDDKVEGNFAAFKAVREYRDGEVHLIFESGRREIVEAGDWRIKW